MYLWRWTSLKATRKSDWETHPKGGPPVLEHAGKLEKAKGGTVGETVRFEIIEAFYGVVNCGGKQYTAACQKASNSQAQKDTGLPEVKVENIRNKKAVVTVQGGGSFTIKY